MQYNIIVLIISAAVFACSGQTSDYPQADVQERESIQNAASTVEGPANSGNFLSYKGVSQDFKVIYNTAEQNYAESIYGNARSGNSLFFKGGDKGYIDNSIFLVNGTSNGNKAVSQINQAVSGQETIFNEIRNNSVVASLNYATRNEAITSGVQGDSKPTIVSGVELEAKVVNDSVLGVIDKAYENEAVNTFQGKAVSGTVNSIGQAEDAVTVFSNKAVDNIAVAHDGRAISGTQNNIGSANDSFINTRSVAQQNTVVGSGGDAVAGVQNNIGTLAGQYGDKNQPSLVARDAAIQNDAVAKDDGKAVSGVSTNIDAVEDAVLDIASFAGGNRATTEGTGQRKKDADAGASLNINSMNNSTLNFEAVATQNEAFNYFQAQDSDATAGVEVVIGSVEDSKIYSDVKSTDNFALSEFGDAVAGNSIDIVNDKGGNNFYITENLYAANNSANALNGGDAIVDSLVTVSGQQLYP